MSDSENESMTEATDKTGEILNQSEEPNKSGEFNAVDMMKLMKAEMEKGFAKMETKLKNLQCDPSGDEKEPQKKKRMPAHEIFWHHKGNRMQYEFNMDILSAVDKVSKLVARGKNEDLEHSDDLLEELTEKLEKRQKAIRLADRSEAGWAAVQEYEQDELASDAEDDRRIRGAEVRAIRRIKSRKGTQGGKPYQRPNRERGFEWGGESSSSGPRPGNFFRQQGAYQGRAGARPGFKAGPCYRCNQFGHNQYECPFFAGQSSQGQQSQKQTA